MNWRALLAALVLALAAAPAAGQAGGAVNVNAQANVRVLRPLQLVTLRDLDFGTIVMRALSSNQTVTLTSSGRSCGSGGQLVCTGTSATALFRVTGTNNQRVLIRPATSTVTLTNGTGGRLSLSLSTPGSLTLPNSGNQGVTFEVGGSLEITPTTPEGMYSGIIDIQVNYQ